MGLRMPDNEKVFLETFILQEKVSRYVEKLSRTRTRACFLKESMPHFRDFEPRYVQSINPKHQNLDYIHKILKSNGAPDTCHLVSMCMDLDGQRLPLLDALNSIFTLGYKKASIIICIPDRLGYYEGESKNDRFLLSR
jgi:hypothetical protein